MCPGSPFSHDSPLPGTPFTGHLGNTSSFNALVGGSLKHLVTPPQGIAILYPYPLPPGTPTVVS